MAKKKKKKESDPDKKVIARNRRARFDYQILDTYEAGISLLGTEVKSLRIGQATIGDAYAAFDGDQLFLYHLHIPEYPQANQFNHKPMRTRRLLMHRAELNKLLGKLKVTGLTLVPLEVYFRKRHVKVMIGLAKGKTKGDKRDTLREKDAKRDIREANR